MGQNLRPPDALGCEVSVFFFLPRMGQEKHHAAVFHELPGKA